MIHDIGPSIENNKIKTIADKLILLFTATRKTIHYFGGIIIKRKINDKKCVHSK